MDDPGGAYTLAFEYVTDQWCYDGSGSYSANITADANVPVFDDYLFEIETEWRVLRALGEAYFDEKSEADRLAAALFGQENGAIINMHGAMSRYLGVNSTEGNWPEP